MSTVRVVDEREIEREARPRPAGVLERNGYARLGDLDEPAHRGVLREMEEFQAEFVASTRELWPPDFAFTGDCLYNWSRRWEYPFCWLALAGRPPGRVLDAGSGITFFPFFLSRRGWRVACADLDGGLGPAYARAGRATGAALEFRACDVGRLAWPDRSFDAVACVSVLEHVTVPERAVGELARVLEPGGRLAITWDVSLSRDCDVLVEDSAVLLAALGRHFDPLFPLDLSRTADLLTTDRVRATEPWRLPWRPSRRWPRRWLARLLRGDPFRSIAVLGSAWVKRG